MALMATTSFAAAGRDAAALGEHSAIVEAIAARDGDAAFAALRGHISKAYETRLRVDAGELKTR
jgi:DNA-binding FadR family transcriptional regulator